jgi:hypothetical protein
MLVGLLRVNKHYEEASAALRDPARRGPVRDLPRQRVVIPVGSPGPEDAYAVAYGLRVFPKDLRLVHFAEPGATVDDVLAGWGDLGQPIELRMRRRSIAIEIRNLVRELRAASEEHDLINLIVPESVTRSRWRHLLHAWHVQRIKAAVVADADVVVTNVAHHASYEGLEPVDPSHGARRVMEGWRHVAVLLVSDVHNATARSLRYALSLRSDDIHCVHVRSRSEGVGGGPPGVGRMVSRSSARGAGVAVPPDREADPCVGARDPRGANTFVTIVIPEFVVTKWWHRILHNQTALTLKGTFLFEPSVVVSAVPYRL